jgi:hypothetical protein
MNNEIIEGKLVFHSQTGTEGGYWAFQDSNYISLVSPVFGVVDGVKVRDINELKPYCPFNEHVDGWWIHADQKGISREEWSKFFFDGFPAILQTYNNEEE